MTTTGRTLSLILILATPPLFAEKAVPRDDSGSSSSSGSSGGDAGSYSGGSSGSSSSGGSSSSSDRSDRAVPRDSGSGSDRGSIGRHSGGSSSRDRGDRGGSSGGYVQSDAERRHPRPRTTRGDDDNDHHSGRGYSRGGRVLYGHYGAHYHGTIYYPYSCYDSHYSYWDYPYRNRYYAYDPTGAVRVLVDPKETKVFVDGYYAGIADDFDGIFQRLYLPPGRHEIALKLEGHKTHRVQIYSARGHTIKLHHDMAQGEGEDEPEDMAGAMGEEGDLAEANAREGQETLAREVARKGGLGTLRLSVSPQDAAVYVNGEFWGNGIREDLKLPAGRHEIAVVRPGFQSFERQVEIRADDTVDLDIDLKKS